MTINISLNGSVLGVEKDSTIKQIREAFDVPADHVIYRLSAPPKKLSDTDTVKSGDLLSSGPKERFVTE